MTGFEDETGGTSTANTIVVRVSRARGNLNALALEELSVFHTNTGLKSAIISLILVAVRHKVRGNALTVDVADESDYALTANSIVSTIGRTILTAAFDQEVSRLTFTLPIAKNCVDSAVFIR